MKQKQLSVRVVIFSLIAISFLTYGLNSCKNVSVSKHKITDTLGPVNTIYHPLGGNYQMAVAKYTISTLKVLDTASNQGKEVADTNWILLIPNTKDTVRDAKGKVRYDSSSHSYQFNNVWYPVKGADKQTVKVQIVNI